VKKSLLLLIVLLNESCLWAARTATEDVCYERCVKQNNVNAFDDDSCKAQCGQETFGSSR
jgi:hypothetical protein